MDYITVKATPESYEDIMEFVFTKIKDEDNLYPSAERVIKDLRLACEEIFINIASYAYPEGSGSVEVGCEVSDGEIFIIMKDNGVPFNPFDREEPDISVAIETRKVGGLGIFIAKRMVDSLCYERESGKNVLKMKKKISNMRA